MSSLLPLIAVIVTVVAGWALIKRYSTHMVLFFAGLVILLCVALMGDANFLPKGVKPSGFWLFDIFATLKNIDHEAGERYRLHHHDGRGALPLIWTASVRREHWLTWL